MLVIYVTKPIPEQILSKDTSCRFMRTNAFTNAMYAANPSKAISVTTCALMLKTARKNLLDVVNVEPDSTRDPS